jgi:hypothetical protein
VLLLQSYSTASVFLKADLIFSHGTKAFLPVTVEPPGTLELTPSLKPMLAILRSVWQLETAWLVTHTCWIYPNTMPIRRQQQVQTSDLEP